MSFDIVFPVIPIIAVPELAVTEDGDLFSDECDVWFAWNGFDVFAIAKATRPKFLSEHDFYFGVLATYAGHIVMNLFWSSI